MSSLVKVARLEIMHEFRPAVLFITMAILNQARQKSFARFGGAGENQGKSVFFFGGGYAIGFVESFYSFTRQKYQVSIAQLFGFSANCNF